jgi:hypothetical protein
LDKELLYDNDTSVDGTHIESIGFAYKHPIVEESELAAIVKGYADRGMFPTGFIKG